MLQIVTHVCVSLGIITSGHVLCCYVHWCLPWHRGHPTPCHVIVWVLWCMDKSRFEWGSYLMMA